MYDIALYIAGFDFFIYQRTHDHLTMYRGLENSRGQWWPVWGPMS